MILTKGHGRQARRRYHRPLQFSWTEPARVIGASWPELPDWPERAVPGFPGVFPFLRRSEDRHSRSLADRG